MNDTSEPLSICAALQEYAQLANDETGEYWTRLIDLQSCLSSMSDDFAKAYHAEISAQLAYAKEHFEIVEEQRTVPHRVRFLRERGGEDMQTQNVVDGGQLDSDNST